MIQIVDNSIPLYFAGKNVITRKTVSYSSTTYTPVRINLYVICSVNGTLYKGAEVKRTLPVVGTGPYEATFDINNVLLSELTGLNTATAFTFPADPDEPIQPITENVLEFYLDWSYTYIDDDGNYQEFGRTDNSADPKFNSLIGGVSNYMQHYLNFKELTFIEYLWGDTQDLKFLSWIPNNMPVHPSQPLRLWLYNTELFTSPSLMVKIKYTDGTESNDITVKTFENLKKLYEIAVGPVELRLITYDVSKQVQSYQVWISDNASVSTERKTFVIDYNYYERNDLMFFRNSLGVSEVLWCHGRRSETSQTQGEDHVQPFLNADYPEFGGTRAHRANYTQSYNMNTGHFPKYMRNYLLDVMAAREVKLPVNFFYLPAVVSPGTFNWGNDADDLFSLPFKAEVAYNESHYALVPDVPSPWGDFNNDFNLDFF